MLLALDHLLQSTKITNLIHQDVKTKQNVEFQIFNNGATAKWGDRQISIHETEKGKFKVTFKKKSWNAQGPGSSNRTEDKGSVRVTTLGLSRKALMVLSELTARYELHKSNQKLKAKLAERVRKAAKQERKENKLRSQMRSELIEELQPKSESPVAIEQAPEANENTSPGLDEKSEEPKV